MTPDALAALHGACFQTPRPWSKAEFSQILGAKGVRLLTDAKGFALIRTIADEAELLTIAVDPAVQRRGIGRRLLQSAQESARADGAKTLFLEVAAGNSAARALYDAAGFDQTGRRKAYYRTPDGKTDDALILLLRL